MGPLSAKLVEQVCRCGRRKLDGMRAIAARRIDGESVGCEAA